MGEPVTLKHAEDMLQEIAHHELTMEPRRIATAEVEVGHNSPIAGKSIGELRFRKKHGITIVGIIRGSERIPMPGADEILKPDDRLIVIGTPELIERIQKESPL